MTMGHCAGIQAAADHGQRLSVNHHVLDRAQEFSYVVANDLTVIERGIRGKELSKALSVFPDILGIDLLAACRACGRVQKGASFEWNDQLLVQTPYPVEHFSELPRRVLKWPGRLSLVTSEYYPERNCW